MWPMALKDLSTAAMVTISYAWLDPRAERPLLESARRVAPLLEDLDAAHAGLLKYQKAERA